MLALEARPALGEVTNVDCASMSNGSITYTFTVLAGTGSSFSLSACGLSSDGSRNGSNWAVTPLTVPIQSAGGSPTVAQAAAAAASTLTGTTTQLSVLGADSGGEAGLTYTWTSSPAGVTFSPNGSNAAKNTTATFNGPGSYTLTASVANATQQVTSAATVSVRAMLTTLHLSPASLAVSPGSVASFASQALDQFGSNLAPSPSITWTASGDGADATGRFTAGATAGTATVTAHAGTLSAPAAVTVSAGASAPPTVATPAAAASTSVSGPSTAVTVLGAETTGGEASLTYTWASSPAGVSSARTDPTPRRAAPPPSAPRAPMPSRSPSPTPPSNR